MTGMEEQKENNKSSFPVKLLKFVFALLVLPFRIMLANPKIALVLLIIAVSVGGTVYLARTKPQLLGIQGQNIDTTQQTKEETEKLVAEVGEIIALPEGEFPTMATVTDVEAVRDQTFFANAQNGDKVLIYSSVKKAFLYRPSQKKIIEVGIVNISQAQNEDIQDGGNIEEAVSPTPQTSEEIVTPTPSPEPTEVNVVTPNP